LVGERLERAILLFREGRACTREDDGSILSRRKETFSRAQKTVTLSSLRKFEIPLPPLDEQRRIAAILDKADALSHKRKRALGLLERLTQSIFLEMFGDPASNPKNWKEKPLSDFEVFLTSGSRGWAKYYSQSGKAFIRIQNLQQGELSTSDIQYVDAPDSAEAKRTTVRSGDVLISITADLGRTAVVPDALDNQAHINQHIALVRTKGINPTYLSVYLASRAGQLQFGALNRQGVKAGLNFDNIRSLRILEPPIALQNKYVDIRKKISNISARYSREALSSRSLFFSLQHRAFSGQL
jgi:type I restriction enzyme S subunit